MYRHLAYWPTYLALIWAIIGQQINQVKTVIDTVLLEVKVSAREVATAYRRCSSPTWEDGDYFAAVPRFCHREGSRS